MKFMVLIPTTGRESLIQVIKQIEDDAAMADIAIEIFIGLNGTLEKYAQPTKSLHVLNISDKPIGISECMNIALTMIPPGILWTFSDDDEWLSGKFSNDLEYITNLEGGTSMLLPRVYLDDSWSSSIRPKKSIENTNIRDYLFAHISLRRNPRYVTMAGACAHTNLWKRVQFSSMSAREDIVYLVQQEALTTEFIQPQSPTVKINIDFNRGAFRDSNIDNVLAWQKEFLEIKHAVGFLACAWPKPFVASGQPLIIATLKNQVNKQNLPGFSLFLLFRIRIILQYWIFIAKVFKFKSTLRLK